MDVSSCNNISSNSKSASTDPSSDESVSGRIQDMFDIPLVHCSMQMDGGQGVVSQPLEKLPKEVKPVIKFCSPNRNRNNKSCINRYLNNYSPDNSFLPAARDTDAWLAPGKVVWVKTVHHGWWPAEVMDTKVLHGIATQHTVKVAVHLFALHERALLNTGDISEFPNCFEERSKNPSEAFQDALGQALSKHGHESPGAKQDRFPFPNATPTHSDKQSDLSNASISSSTKDDIEPEEGKGKRKRKSKIPFDELSFPDNPARKVRRLKIMRSLGLAAPVGSPFTFANRSSS